MRDYDVLVLGGGSAGSAAAAAAHAAGARTAMFNDGPLGGLCILRGCMPTKSMLHAAHAAHHAAHPGAVGIRGRLEGVDFRAVMAAKDRKVERFQRSKIAKIERAGYEIIDARAVFAGPDRVEANGERYRFARGAVIATGSVPAIAPIPGIDTVPYLTSDEVMRLETLPDSVLVLGIGAVGLELSQFFARMGARTQLFSRRLVFEDVDPLLVEEMQRVVADEPRLELIQPFSPVRIEGDATRVTAVLGDGRRFTAERLIVATGRRPAIAGLGLERAGVEVVAGHVVAGADMRTSNPRVFVAGDASGEPLLLHVANWEGRVAGLNAAGAPGDLRVEQRLDMSVIFTDPPMARLGLNEDGARAAGHDVITAHVQIPRTGRAITQDVQHGVLKLVAERRRGELLGAQILGPRADDIIHTLASIMYYRGTAADMLGMPWYHPTLSEVLLELARELVAQVEPAAS
jgi:pyruvate/2-oxoglutarate dehydrogenase complex dihydrolipoamide dehydrogenase (E3) component